MGLPPPHVQDAAHEAQRLRGWLGNAYAQVEYMLDDLIMRAKVMPEYHDLVGRLPHGAPKRVRKIREILARDGFFDPYRERLEALLGRFEEHHELRNVLAHGFCTIYFTPDDDVGFQFRKWHRGEDDEDTEIIEMFRIVDLEYHEAQLRPLADQSLGLLREIHGDLGLIGQ